MKRPLAAFGITYFFALLAAAVLPPAVLLLPVAFLLAALLIKRHGRHFRRDVCILLAAVAAAAGVHFGSHAFIVRPAQNLIGETALVQAEVESSASSYVDGMIRATLHVRKMNGVKANFRVSCASLPESELGDEIELRVSFVSLEKAYELQNYADGVFVSAEYAGDYRWLGESRSMTARCKRLQLALSRILRKNLSKESAGVAAAMVLGDKSHLSDEIKTLFRHAGTSHLLVVSGLHLAMLCGMLWISNTPRFSHFRLRAVGSILLVLALMAITGFTPSVCRAGIVAIIYYIAVILMRPPDALTSFAVAAILMGTQNCYAVCDIGLQLSFAAAAGVIFSGMLRNAELNRLNDDTGEKAKLLALPMLIQTAFFASLFTLPVLLLQNLSVSGASVISNLLTLWLAQPILLFGYLAILCGVIPPLRFLYWGMLSLLGVCIRLLLWLTNFCASLPFAGISLPREYTCLVWLVLAGLVFLALRLKTYRWLAISLPVCAAAAVSLALVFEKNTVKIVMVGSSNNSSAIILQNGEAAVLFRGGASNAAAVRDYLDLQAVSQIETLVDLRAEPSPVKLPARRTVTASEVTAEEIDLLPGIPAQLLHAGGNLVVVDVSGWQFGMMAGNVQLQQPVTLDAFVAGGVLSEQISFRDLLLTSKSFSWLEDGDSTAEQCDTMWYGSDPEIWIRPGKSVTYREVERYECS